MTPFRFPLNVVGSAVCVAILALVLPATPRAAQAGRDLTALPTAAQVFARHVAAIGGEAAFTAVRSMHATGRFEVPAQRLTGDLELFSARPARLLFRVNIPGIGRIENGYDGKIGWALSPLSGPELMTGRQLLEAGDDAWFDAPLHGPDHIRSADVVGRVEFDGHQAYRVRLTTTAGSDAVEYFDVESGLQIGVEASRATPQGIVPTVNMLRDYKKVGALMLPMTSVQRALGFEQIVTLTSCEFDTVPDAIFVVPAEIRALVRP